jgi:hypothetical protein
VYKNSSKIALAIKQAVAPFPKVLLTATPLQNSLLELYGLVSIIDEFAFGDLQSFRSRFARLGDDADFAELKERLAPLCKRTLRRQVLEYVKYTNRHALVQEFVPTSEEQRLYDLVSRYLQREALYALPARQRQLMTLILRKLLDSSTYAIAGTLESMVRRLEAAAVEGEAVSTTPESLPEDWEQLDELADEWEEDDATSDKKGRLTPDQIADLKREMAELQEFHGLAKSITKNSKGEVLLTALRRGFAAAAEAQAAQGSPPLQQKAVIFTESRRTQVNRWTSPSAAACSTYRPRSSGHASYPRPSPRRWPRPTHPVSASSSMNSPPATVAGSIWKWINSIAGQKIDGPHSRRNWTNLMMRSRKPRRPFALRPPCPKRSSVREPCASWKPNGPRPRKHSTKHRARSTGRRTLCLTRSVSGWSRSWKKSRSLRCDGRWPKGSVLESRRLPSASESSSERTRPSTGPYRDVPIGRSNGFQLADP